MKYFYYLIVSFIITGICLANGFDLKHQKFFPTLKELSSIQLKKSTGGLITYFHISNSINGPFTSPAVLSTKDSLFLKMDVTPGGSIQAIFWVDINENDLIDDDDFPIGAEEFTDNSTMDLDPTPGVIIIYLNPENIPSMKIIAQAFEGLQVVLGYVSFINPPAQYTFSGYVYDASTLQPIKAATVAIAKSESEIYSDITNVNGYFNIPIDGGTYYVRAEHMFGQYQPFDTMMTINGDYTHNFYLKTLNSYIRGYVKDDLSNPIPNVEIYVNINNWGFNVVTDSSGHYLIYVPSGNGRIGLSSSSVIPNYMVPGEHYFSIGDNDSIVNNNISNFTCYRANGTITGKVTDNIHMPPKPPYVVGAWSHQLTSFTEAITDGAGNYILHVHANNVLNPTYSVWVNVEHWQYPFPEDVYVDTSYWGLVPGSIANFKILPAETSAVDHFTGNNVNPDPNKWFVYSFGNPWGPQSDSYIMLMDNKLEIKCKSSGGTSGLGVMSKKPFSLKNREFRIYIEPQALGLNNTAHIMFTNQLRYDKSDYINNLILLNWSFNGWNLDLKIDNNTQTVWSSNNPAGGHILFQFLDNPKILRLKIDGNVKYEGPWGGHLPFAYYYAFTQNDYPVTAGVLKFDEFFVGAIGSTDVKEISNNVPSQFSLLQNYPNPFNPKSNIRYQILTNSFVILKVYNLLGQEVATLVNSEHKPGSYEVEFDANHLAGGMYIYRLNAFDPTTGKTLFSDVKKALLLK